MTVFHPTLQLPEVIEVRMLPTSGPHAIWEGNTHSWFLPVVGPSAVAAMLTLYGTAQAPDPSTHTEDFAFLIGVGIPQLARTFERMLRFGVITSLTEVTTRLIIEVPSHLPAIGEHHRRRWPRWFDDAYSSYLRAVSTLPPPTP